MNNVTKIVAALLVLLAVLLGVYAFVLATKPPTQVAASVQPVQPASQQYDVVVADKLLPGGTPIDAAALKVVKLPINPEGSYANTTSLAGKIPKFDIGPGTPVTESGLVKGLTLLLEAGQRAVAVSVDEVIGTGNRVTPGDFVDVFFMLKQGQDVNKTQSRLLLSRLKVLTYGDASVDGNAPADKAPAQAGQSPQNKTVPRTAVLAVPSADVNRLLLAAQNDRLQLALRNPTDDTAPDVALFPEAPPVLPGKTTLTAQQRDELNQPDNKAFAGTELAGLAGDARAAVKPVVRIAQPVARRETPAPVVEQNSVEVVRGTKRETVGF
jgi:pilus assembly protein CpaB